MSRYLNSYRVILEMESGKQLEWEGYAEDQAHAEGLAIEWANAQNGEQVADMTELEEFDQFEEISEEEAEERYDEWLDCEGVVKVAGMEFYPSKIISECDPIAYRCGFSDFTDLLLGDHVLVEGYY